MRQDAPTATVGCRCQPVFRGEAERQALMAEYERWDSTRTMRNTETKDDWRGYQDGDRRREATGEMHSQVIEVAGGGDGAINRMAHPAGSRTGQVTVCSQRRVTAATTIPVQASIRPMIPRGISAAAQRCQCGAHVDDRPKHPDGQRDGHTPDRLHPTELDPRHATPARVVAEGPEPRKRRNGASDRTGARITRFLVRKN